VNVYQSFIAKSRYCRFLPEKNRREHWPETVARYFDFMATHLYKNHDYKLTKSLREELESAVLELSTMPSMRTLMTAGPALERSNVAGYNCAYLVVDDQKAFDECMYILLCFHPDTLVKTSKGDKCISDITVSDEVLSYNEETKEFSFICPERVLRNDVSQKQKIRLTFEGGKTVDCTEDHLFLTQRGWVQAQELTDEDDIKSF
jgi:hypothetical protein